MEEEYIFFDFKKEPGLIKEGAETKQDIEPKISIITSYYNSGEYIMQTYNCVISQTFPYWEWIIVDDGSTDKKSLSILDEIEQKDSRIRVYHKVNEGLAKRKRFRNK